MKLSDIEYPIYRLKSDTYTEDGITYNSNDLIVDNKNLPGLTLSDRRLKYPNNKLAMVGDTIFSLGAAIKYPRNTRFIDSYGGIFKIPKSTYYTLICREIEDVKQDWGIYVSYFKCANSWIKYTGLHPPKVGEFAMLLIYRKGYLLYDVLPEKVSNTRVKL